MARRDTDLVFAAAKPFFATGGRQTALRAFHHAASGSPRARVDALRGPCYARGKKWGCRRVSRRQYAPLRPIPGGIGERIFPILAVRAGESFTCRLTIL
jgi:hypothetical protein